MVKQTYSEKLEQTKQQILDLSGLSLDVLGGNKRLTLFAKLVIEMNMNPKWFAANFILPWYGICKASCGDHKEH